METAKCPLCLAENTPYEIVGKMHDMYFRCDSCERSLVITDPAYKILLDYTQDAKEQNIRNFKEINEDHIWYFYVPIVERKEGIAFPAVEAKQIQKQNLLS